MNRRLPFAFLLLVLAVHFVVVLRHHARPLVGDEPYYAGKARWIASHGTFQPLPAREAEIVAGRAWGTSDWRPQGYPLLLTAIGLGVIDNLDAFRLRVTIVQFVAVALLLLQLQRIAGGWPSAVLLALSPWPFEYAGDLGPDTINAVILGAALLLAWRWILSPEPAPAGLFLAMLVASSTLLFRPEMIAIVPPFALVALLLRRRIARITGRDLAAAAIAFTLVIGAQVAYRWQVTGQPGLFGALRIINAGAFDWTRTWLGTEKEAYDFVYAVTDGHEPPPLPDRAFGSARERAVVAEAARRARTEGYGASIDRTFAALAEERRREHPLLVAAVRALNAPQLWFHLETNPALLNALASWPSMPRRVLLALLLLVKCAAVLLGALGMLRSWRRWLRREHDALDVLILLCGAYVVTRTLLIGVVLDWRVHRYVISAWPPLLLCAARPFGRPAERMPSCS